MILRIGRRDLAIEHGIGLAWIGIDAEEQRIGGKPAKIDDATLDRLRRIDLRCTRAGIVRSVKSAGRTRPAATSSHASGADTGAPATARTP